MFWEDLTTLFFMFLWWLFYRWIIKKALAHLDTMKDYEINRLPITVAFFYLTCMFYAPFFLINPLQKKD